MKNYVLGFAFDTTLRVALIQKNRPEEQAGKWNAIGGKIEAGEDPANAMIREFQEETGVYTSAGVWQHFATLRGGDYQMYCYVTVWQPEHLDMVKTMESEIVRIFTPEDLSNDAETLMDNLRWLMPMALTLSETEIPALIEFGKWP